MFKRFLYRLHRILGTFLSILFVLWFLTGFVMIFHNFPRISNVDKFKGLQYIDITKLKGCDSLLATQISDEDIESWALKAQTDGSFLVEAQSKNNTYLIDKKNINDRYNYSEIYDYASRLNTSAINRIDTIYKLDRWLPYDRYKADFPVYRFYYQDSLQSQLYVSSRSGEGIQYTNSINRFWAWMGAIPHWLHIANLRHSPDLWKYIIISLSGIGTILCITGLIIGVRSIYKNYKHRKKVGSPYRKTLYKWHHILGLIFGIFVFTFIFSGMMSLQKVPQWLIKTYNSDLQKAAVHNPLSRHPLEYSLNYKIVLMEYAGRIRKLEWASFGNLNYYRAVVEDSIYYINASSDTLRSLSLSESNIRERLSTIHSEPMSIELLCEYDNYYIHRRNKLPLPIYKVTVEDRDNSIYYINPHTADTRYFNANMRAGKWTYQALHSFSIKWLLNRPILWNIIMWTTMIGGTFVSLTALWISFRVIKRKLKRRKK